MWSLSRFCHIDTWPVLAWGYNLVYKYLRVVYVAVCDSRLQPITKASDFFFLFPVTASPAEDVEQWSWNGRQTACSPDAEYQHYDWIGKQRRWNFEPWLKTFASQPRREEKEGPVLPLYFTRR